MKTLTKSIAINSFIQRNSHLLLIFLGLLLMSNNNGISNDNILIKDDSYSSLTKELIYSNLKDCKHEVVWLGGIELQAAPLICSFYEANNYAPVWTNGNELTEQSMEVINLLKDSYKYGFDPSNFNVEALNDLTNSMAKENNLKKSAKYRASYEFLMTNSVFTFMHYISYGMEFSITKDIIIKSGSDILSFPEYLNKAIAKNNVKDEILRIQPNDKEYIALQQEMENIVLNMVSSDHTVEIPENTDDLLLFFNLFSDVFTANTCIKIKPELSDPEMFNKMLIEFQNSLGLRTSGKIDKATKRTVEKIIMTRYQNIVMKLDSIRKRNIDSKSLVASKI